VALETGTRLGSHEILGLLGAGGMGEVYRAQDTKLNRQVAIKVLPETYASDPERVARFHREAQAVARSIIRTSPRSTISLKSLRQAQGRLASSSSSWS
jgi:serine/threonine protein kinase